MRNGSPNIKPANGNRKKVIPISIRESANHHIRVYPINNIMDGKINNTVGSTPPTIFVT
jgi:hypothetical protein